MIYCKSRLIASAAAFHRVSIKPIQRLYQSLGLPLFTYKSILITVRHFMEFSH